MDQRFEGQPKADIRLEGNRLIRGDVTNDWGSQLIWEIRRNGEVVSTVPAGTTLRDLNGEVARGAPVPLVAREWLESQGLR